MKKNLIFVSCIPCISLQELKSDFQQLSNQCEVDVTSLELFWELEEKGELDGKNSHLIFLISSPMEMMCLPRGKGLVSTDFLVENLERIKEFFINNFQNASIVDCAEFVKRPMNLVSTLIPGSENAFADGAVALHLSDFSVIQKIESMAAVSGSTLLRDAFEELYACVSVPSGEEELMNKQMALMLESIMEQIAHQRAESEQQIQTAEKIKVEAWRKVKALESQLQKLTIEHSKNIKTFKSSISELESENELSLLQIHQLQEELEHYYAKSGFEPEQKLQASEKTKAEALSKVKVLETQLQKLITEHKKDTNILKSSISELESENELSLLQIHQLQEELEHYYLKYVSAQEELEYLPLEKNFKITDIQDRKNTFVLLKSLYKN